MNTNMNNNIEDKKAIANKIKIGKIIIWVAIGIDIFSILLTLALGNKLNLGNNLNQKINPTTIAMVTVVVSCLVLLLYILPLTIVKDIKILRNWSIAWIVFASLALLIHFFSLVFNVISIFSIIKIISTILTFTGSILLIINCKKWHN